MRVNSDAGCFASFCFRELRQRQALVSYRTLAIAGARARPALALCGQSLKLDVPVYIFARCNVIGPNAARAPQAKTPLWKHPTQLTAAAASRKKWTAAPTTTTPRPANSPKKKKLR